MLTSIVRVIERLNRLCGMTVCWLSLGMVLIQFILVLLRYVFGIGYIALQESVLWMHSAVFLLASAWTLSKDGHVRVDIFYRTASERTKAWVDLGGTVAFLWPFCFVLGKFAWPYVRNSWTVAEASPETAGLPALYLLKSLILVLSIMLAIQGIAVAVRCVATLMNVPLPLDLDAPKASASDKEATR